MGMASLHAVEAKGYFDVEITCEGPLATTPASCFLDGLQVSTGATLGKRNLQWVKSEKIVIHVKNTRTGQTATLRPREQFLTLLPQPNTDPVGEPKGSKPKPSEGDHHSEDLARRIAIMPEKEILTIGHP